jgi:hypothetical protein
MKPAWVQRHPIELLKSWMREEASLELPNVASKASNILVGKPLLEEALVETLDLLGAVIMALENGAFVTEAALLGASTADLAVGHLGWGSAINRGVYYHGGGSSRSSSGRRRIHDVVDKVFSLLTKNESVCGVRIGEKENPT